MEDLLTGFLKGLGGTVGVLIAIGIFALIGYLISKAIENYRNTKEIPGLLLEYRKYLKKTERFEELCLINKYKNELKKNILPKELAQRYSLIVSHYLDMEETSESRGRCFIGTQKMLVVRNIPLPNDKKQQNNSENEEKPNNPDEGTQNGQTDQEK